MTNAKKTLLEQLEELKAKLQVIIDQLTGDDGGVSTQSDDTGSNPPGDPPPTPPGTGH